jgi:hypothetical protein
MKSAFGVVLLLVVFLRSSVVDAAVIVDTLGVATPTTHFSVFGTGGLGISPLNLVGPEFTLPTNMVLTEIGAFVNNCANIVLGVPQCPATLPFIVQIRPSTGGVPDPSTVLASLELSHDNDPLLVSFESVAITLDLGAGSYFALFGPQQTSDAGFLLGSASSPFPYVAGLTTFGFIDNGHSSTGLAFGAVRITAATVPEPSSLTLLAGALAIISFAARRRRL